MLSPHVPEERQLNDEHLTMSVSRHDHDNERDPAYSLLPEHVAPKLFVPTQICVAASQYKPIWQLSLFRL